MNTKSKDEERYVFRSMEQRNFEPIESFVKRLRNQIEKCGYDKNEKEQRLKEQIIDRCSNGKLREIALNVALNVEGLISTGAILEANMNEKTSEKIPKIECSRCKSSNHIQSDPECPAKRSRCHFCDRFGHFSKMCKKLKIVKKPNTTKLVEWKIPKLQNKESEPEKMSPPKVAETFVPESSENKSKNKKENLLSKPENVLMETSKVSEVFEKAKNVKHETAENGNIYITTVDINTLRPQSKTVEPIKFQVDPR